MMQKIYERTGIKEENKLKDRQEKLIEKQNSEREIRHCIERGIYKESCLDRYNLGLMDYEKEYRKTEDLLMLYQYRSLLYEDNLCYLIGGYLEYFDTYGSHMTALGLRGFRRSIETVINLAYNVEKMKKKEAQIEDAMIDFVIDCYDEIECLGKEISIPGLGYLIFDLEEETRVPQKYEEVKEKVKIIYEELKSN